MLQAEYYIALDVYETNYEALIQGNIMGPGLREIMEAVRQELIHHIYVTRRTYINNC